MFEKKHQPTRGKKKFNHYAGVNNVLLRLINFVSKKTKKRDFKTKHSQNKTMKLNSSLGMLAPTVAWLVAESANGYMMPRGGFDYSSRRMPKSMTPEQRQEFNRKQAEFVNRAFESLTNEFNKDATNRGHPRKERKSTTASSEKSQEEYVEDLGRSAFGFMESLVNGIGEDYGDDPDAKQFLNIAKKGLGIAKDVTEGMYSPAYDIDEDETMLKISIDLPGVDKSNVTIDVEEERMLVVSGQRDKMTKGVATPIKFSKKFPLDGTIDTNKITASLENGVLVIEALKKEEERVPPGKRIPVL